MTESQGVEAFHQLELNTGRFLIQRCTGCGKHVYYPREACPHCDSTSLDWISPKGGGTVYAVTTVRRKPAEGGDINVSLVDLDEGVRLMGRIDNLAPGAVSIGQRVNARVQVKDGKGLVLFDAVDGGAL
ncbi:Zn-ribbon domain-containing OB-fold protein [Bradyrhizobium mercantei]|uniref:Zn-ribbon domain-containing OB-fold protein n=1 Tax=Bradyrhizobium mercantei TaxID=1904807 RepID=UPI00097571C1|nr:OB-fold domain-containing protein [Bradyrhizobium mercantei]